MKPAETAERVVDDPTRCVIPASPSEEALTGTPGVTEERMGCSRAVRLRRGGNEFLWNVFSQTISVGLKPVALPEGVGIYSRLPRP